MNKQEAIEKIEKILLLPTDDVDPSYDLGYNNGLRKAKSIIEKIEPKKPVIPQFIADKIEYCKKIDGYRLFNAMDYCYSFKKCAEWLESNEKNFALAWIFGYEVEKEKRYTVKMRATKQPLFYNNMYEKIFFSLGELATRFTRKELEEAGFGWVFDCPGMEIEEVE